MLIRLCSQRKCPSITSHRCYRSCSCWAAAWPPRQPAHRAHPPPRNRDSWKKCKGPSCVARRRPQTASGAWRTPPSPVQRVLRTVLSAAPRPRQAECNVEHKLPAARQSRRQRRQGLLPRRHRKQRGSQCPAVTPFPAAPRGVGARRQRSPAAAPAEQNRDRGLVDCECVQSRARSHSCNKRTFTLRPLTLPAFRRFSTCCAMSPCTAT